MVGRTSISVVLQSLAALVVLQLPRLCEGYRLEGQILETELDQASLSQHVGAEIAFAASSGGGKSKGTAATTGASGERTGGDPDPTRAEKDEQCHLAVSGSTWTRNKRCECGEDMMVKCPSEPCNLYGRRFGLEALEGKGCGCSACAVTCEAVPGAKTRTAKWKKLLTGRDCECEEGFYLAGESDDCRARGKDHRYFKAKKVVDRGCSCTSAEADTPEEPKVGKREPSADPAADVEDPGTKEAPKEMWQDPKFGKNIVYGGTSSVVLCCFLVMICKVYKTVSSVEVGEDIDYTTTEATLGRTGTEATEAPFLFNTKSENQQQKQSQRH